MDELRGTIRDLGIQQSQLMNNIAQLTNATLRAGKPLRHQAQPNRVEHNYFSTTKLGKIEFPQFSEEDFEGWLYRCERFFAFDGTPEELKQRLVVIN